MAGGRGWRRSPIVVALIVVSGLSLLVGAGWYAFGWWGVLGSNSDDTRIVVSPWVEHPELQEADEVLFEVVSDQPTRWRLATLNNYEDDIWKLAGDFRDLSDGTLGSVDQTGVGLVATIEVVDLSQIWLPVPPRATSMDTDDFGITWQPESGTTAVGSLHTSPSPGSSYTVGYQSVTTTPIGDLSQSSEGDAASLDPEYLLLVQDPATDDAFASIASMVEDPAANVGEQVGLLIRHFGENFMIDPAQNPSSAYEPGSLERFLAEGRGSERDAVTSFALLARHLGIPSRVAVGFGPGEVVGTTPDGRSRHQVRGRHAMVWPEVFIDDTGWVAIELM